MIAAQLGLLDEIAGDDWWVDVTLADAGAGAPSVRGLVSLIDRAHQVAVYTDFEDELGEATELALRGVTVAADFERFRAKARAYLRAHEDHLALQKVRRNVQLSPVDVEALGRMLTDAGIGGPSEIAAARAASHGLGVFIRSLVGLEWEAAVEAMNGFLDAKLLSANQIDFVNLIVGHLTEHGVMDAGALFDSPFTDVAPRGPTSLFSADQVGRLVGVLEHVRSTAAPDVA